MGMLGDADDDELLRELDEYEEDLEQKKLEAELSRLDVGTPDPVVSWPSAPRPSEEQQAKERREAEELAQLEASMNMTLEQPMPMPMAAVPMMSMASAVPAPER